jgi:hypothetical protein
MASQYVYVIQFNVQYKTKKKGASNELCNGDPFFVTNKE